MGVETGTKPIRHSRGALPIQIAWSAPRNLLWFTFLLNLACADERLLRNPARFMQKPLDFHLQPGAAFLAPLRMSCENHSGFRRPDVPFISALSKGGASADVVSVFMALPSPP